MKSIKFSATVAGLLVFVNPQAFCADQNLDGLRNKLASPVYETRVAAVTEFLDMGKKNPLTKGRS